MKCPIFIEKSSEFGSPSGRPRKTLRRTLSMENVLKIFCLKNAQRYLLHRENIPKTSLTKRAWKIFSPQKSRLSKKRRMENILPEKFRSKDSILEVLFPFAWRLWEFCCSRPFYHQITFFQYKIRGFRFKKPFICKRGFKGLSLYRTVFGIWKSF